MCHVRMRRAGKCLLVIGLDDVRLCRSRAVCVTRWEQALALALVLVCARKA